MTARASLGPLLRAFFADHLVQQKAVSPQTITAYRDAFRRLLTFLDQHRRRKPESLTLDDLDAPVILAFLDHLEDARANSVKSRNARLAAIRSFVRFAALRAPESVDLTSRVLAIPRKRAPRRQIHYLTRSETDAILAGCDRSSHGGRAGPRPPADPVQHRGSRLRAHCATTLPRALRRQHGRPALREGTQGAGRPPVGPNQPVLASLVRRRG